MSDTRWKAFERRVAVLLGTQRIPVTGERDGADFETPMFCFQAKKRKTFPGYVADWLEAIRRKAATRSPAKTGVVILQQPGGQDLDALVVVSLRDWLELHGPSRAAEAIADPIEPRSGALVGPAANGQSTPDCMLPGDFGG